MGPSGCCTTPFNVISTFSREGTLLDNVKTVVDPSPTNSSTLLSATSNARTFAANIVPKKDCPTLGAEAKCIVDRWSTLNPVDGLVVSSMGFWTTLFIETISWDDLVILAIFPPVCVALNFLFTPSNDAVNVCEEPDPNPDKLIAVPAAALLAFVASLNVFLSTLIIKNAVLFVNPPILDPPPFEYTTLCPCTNLFPKLVIVLSLVETTDALDPSNVRV